MYFETEELCISTNVSIGTIKTIDIIDNKEIRFIENQNLSSIITSLSMSILINEKMSPEFSILMFYVINGEVIPDSISVPVEKCLKNKVKIFLSIFFKE